MRHYTSVSLWHDVTWHDMTWHGMAPHVMWHVTPCHVTSRDVMSLCGVMWRHVDMWRYVTSHGTSRDVLWRHIAMWRHVMWRHVTSCLVTSFQDVMWRHVMSCHALKDPLIPTRTVVEEAFWTLWRHHCDDWINNLYGPSGHMTQEDHYVKRHRHSLILQS